MADLAASLAKLDRLIATRRGQYKTQVTKGRMSVEDAAAKDQELTVLRNQFAFLVEHGALIRRLVQAEFKRVAEFQAFEDEQRAQREAIKGHPAVAEVLEKFPEASIGAVTDIKPKHELELTAEPEAEVADA